MTRDELISRFAALLESEQRAGYVRKFGDAYPDLVSRDCAVRVVPGKRWTKVDVGTSGKYVVDLDGKIYGIKAYGVPNLKKYYGTLETVEGLDWSGFTAVLKPGTDWAALVGKDGAK